MGRRSFFMDRIGAQWAVLTIDGSYGEGGGQILRTAASLAAITGLVVRVERIRAGRAAPGLKAQHLTAIQAAMRVCGGDLVGGHKGSTEVEMNPGPAVRPGGYEFDVGTAGSTTLVLQTVLMPLLLASAASEVAIVGGTHNDHAPSSDYLQHVFLAAAGLPTVVTVERVGFFPRGGGRIVATILPRPIEAIALVQRGAREILSAIVTVSDDLPTRILDRAQLEIEARADATEWPLSVVLSSMPSLSPGMAFHLTATYEGGYGGFTALGRKGLRTDRVVENAWSALKGFDPMGASVDEHLADQLVLPMLFATGPSEYRTSRVSEHLRTMAWLVPQFGVGRVDIDEMTGHVRVTPSSEDVRLNRDVSVRGPL